MTFLELCQDYVKEHGIAGGAANTPGSVTGQTGELGNVVRWIADATLWIDNLWRDWKYLKVPYLGILTADGSAGSRYAPAPNNPLGVLVRQWDRSSLWLNKQTGEAKRLKYQPFEEFQNTADIGADVASVARPSVFTVTDDNRILFDRRPSAPDNISGGFWRRPTRLVSGNEAPLMPGEYHRIIIARASIMYGNREDAPEVISGMEAEYIDLIEKLQSDQIASFQYDRMGGQDFHAEGAIPGQDPSQWTS